MSSGIDIKINGAEELYNSLLQMPLRLEKNILRAAVRAGSAVIATEAQRNAPVLQQPDARRIAGTVRKAIRVRSTRQVGDLILGGVAVRMLTTAQIKRFKTKHGQAGANNPNDPFYAFFPEYGTSKMQARPFLRPALESQSGAAIAAFTDVVSTRLNEVNTPA